jgi:hypothetical protein
MMMKNDDDEDDAEEDGDEDDVLILLCTHLESFLSLPPPQPPYHPQGGLIGNRGRVRDGVCAGNEFMNL